MTSAKRWWRTGPKKGSKKVCVVPRLPRCGPKHKWEGSACRKCGRPKPGTRERLIFNFWRKVKKTPGCWIWIGARIKSNGYGLFNWTDRKRVAHHVSWFLAHGEWPADGLESDHLCRVRHCVRPSHMELVTHKENIQRASTHCARGHALKGNRFISGKSSRCRICYEAKLARARMERRKRGLKKPGRKKVLR